MKKSSSVHKSLLLLSPPLAPTPACFLEREKRKHVDRQGKTPIGGSKGRPALGWWEPRNVLCSLLPGEGPVVQGRASGSPRGPASPGSQPAPLPPTSWEAWASLPIT